MPKVAVIGVGQSAFVRAYPVLDSRIWHLRLIREAMQECRPQKPSSELMLSVICSAPEYDKQRTPAGLMAEYLGLNPQPTFYVESVCSSSSSGLRTAYALDCLRPFMMYCRIVLGFQKMSEISSAESQERMGRGAGHSVGSSIRYHDAGVLCDVRSRPFRKIWDHRRGSCT